jgi:DNA-binding transcriptional LysR family regulator
VDVRTSFTDLARHHSDVAIRFREKPSQSDIVAKLVSLVGGGLYASRSYLKKHGRPARLEDLKQHAIVRGDEQVSAMPMERLIDRYGDPLRIAYRSNSFIARLGAIKEGVGVGMLGCHMCERENTLEHPQTTPYKWWNWRDNYEASPDPKWAKVSDTGEAAFRKREEAP